MAARATFALKAGFCVRRARLAIVTPDMRHSRRSQADFPLIGLSEFAQPPLLRHDRFPMRQNTWKRRSCLQDLQSPAHATDYLDATEQPGKPPKSSLRAASLPIHLVADWLQ